MMTLDNDLVFSDNNAVSSLLISGRSSNDVLKKFEWEDEHGVNNWFERIENHANIADGPSRGSFDNLKGSKRKSLDPYFILNTMDHS